MKNNSRPGFTTTECCVVTAIVAIASLVSYPLMSSIKHSEKLRAELRHVSTCIMQARVEAIKRNTHVVVEFENNKIVGFVDDGKGGGQARDRVRQPGELELFSYVLSDNISAKTNFPSNKFYFTNRVGIKPRPGTITLNYDETPYGNVVINITGRVRIEKL